MANAAVNQHLPPVRDMDAATELLPESLLPDQFRFANLRPWTPERELYAALLTDAFDVLRGHAVGVTAYEQRKTEAWFLGVHGAVSLRDVCVALGLDENAVRRQARKVFPSNREFVPYRGR